MSLTHLLIVAFILLLFFGPSKLPALGKTLGQSLKDFKKGLSQMEDIDVTDSVKKVEDNQPTPAGKKV
jgi:sec-independent protein translocase protein TatA